MSREIFGKEQKEKHICWRCSKLKFLGVESKTELRDNGGPGELTKTLRWTMNRKDEVDYSVNVKEEFLHRRNPLSKIVVEVLSRSNHAI